MTKQPRPPVLVVVSDMIFRSKIAAAAARANRELATARDGKRAIALARELGPSLAIVDLDDKRFDGLLLVARFKGDAELARIELLGFLPHVQAERRRAALEAGCDRVMPRSQFVRELAGALEAGE